MKWRESLPTRISSGENRERHFVLEAMHEINQGKYHTMTLDMSHHSVYVSIFPVCKVIQVRLLTLPFHLPKHFNSTFVMAEQAGQHVLQAGLSSGLSATLGVHSKAKNGVDPSLDGTRHHQPQDFIPTTESRLTFHGKNGTKVQFPYLSCGAWSWGDTAIWHWSDDEMPALK